MSTKNRNFVRHLLDRSAAPLIAYTLDRIEHYRLTNAMYDLAVRDAVESSFEHAQESMPAALVFKKRTDLWDYALSKISFAGICAEFGVWKGTSINYFADKVDRIYGFDSFEGLKEDWSGWGYSKGAFNLGGKMPKVKRNVSLIRGWFDETIPPFLEFHPGPCSFVHIDCDTYESSALALGLLSSRLVPGTVILFDEYFGYRGWQAGEFKAWHEFVQSTNVNFEYLGFSSQKVAIKLLPA